MAEYPTRQFSASNAYSAYMQSLEDEEEKKKAYNMVHHMYKLTNPHYAGSSAENRNLSKISKLGSGTSSGLATRLRLMTAADKENLGMEFTGAFQQALESDLFTSLKSFNTWANKQGPWYGEDLRRKHATTVKDLLDAQKSSKVAEAVDDLYDKYWPAWGSGLFEDQMRVRNEIADDEIVSSLPKKYQSEAIKQIHARLRDTLTATGRDAAAVEARRVAAEDRSAAAEGRSVLAEEERVWKFDKLKSEKANVTASIAIARQMSDRVEELVSGGMNIQQAKNKVAEEYEKTAYDRDEFNKSVKTRVGEDATLTSPSKRTGEMVKFLKPTGNDENDLLQSQLALESEIRSLGELNPAWHTFGIAKQRSIAVENFLRILGIADRGRAAELDSLKASFEKSMESFEGDEVAIEAEIVRIIEESVNKLRLPRLVIEFILFPEKFEFGKKG